MSFFRKYETLCHSNVIGTSLLFGTGFIFPTVLNEFYTILKENSCADVA